MSTEWRNCSVPSTANGYSDPPTPESRGGEPRAAHLCAPVKKALPQSQHLLAGSLRDSAFGRLAFPLKMETVGVLWAEWFNAGGPLGRASPQVDGPSVWHLPCSWCSSSV